MKYLFECLHYQLIEKNEQGRTFRKIGVTNFDNIHNLPAELTIFDVTDEHRTKLDTRRKSIAKNSKIAITIMGKSIYLWQKENGSDNQSAGYILKGRKAVLITEEIDNSIFLTVTKLSPAPKEYRKAFNEGVLDNEMQEIKNKLVYYQNTKEVDNE